MEKKLLLFFGLFLFFPILSQGVKAEVYNVYNCRTIDSSGYWRLMTNISTTDAICFSITASDVILDLNGYSIIHNLPSGSLRTINLVVPFYNVTVKNGFIYAGTDNVSDSSIVWVFPNCYTCENFTIKDLKGYGISGKFLKYGIYITGGYWGGHLYNTIIDNIDFSNVFANYTLYITVDPWINILYTTIKNSDFRYSRAYDIYISSDRVKHLTSCGLKFNESKVYNVGYNVSLSKEDCAIVMPEYPIKVLVIDGLREKALLENCYVFTNATVCVDGRCLNQTNAYLSEQRCYIPGKANFLFYPPIYEFIVTESKFYTINATYPGYKPQNQTVYVDGLTPIFFYLYGIDTYDLTVMVKDYHTLEPIGGAKILLYYENGTLYEHPLYGTMYQYTNDLGYVRLPGLTPNLNYYFTLSKFGYEPYKSPIFNLTQDLTFEVSMKQAVELLILTATPTQNVYANTTVFWTVNNTLGTPAGSTSIYCQRGAEPEFEVISFYAHINPYTVGASIGKDGTIRCWAYSHTYNMTSNDVWFNVGTAVPYYPELGVYSIIFHPIFIGTMLLISISAYIEYKLRTNGKAFLVAIIILTFVLSIVGFYPAWVGILIIMAVGFILVYLFREIFWG